MTRESCPGSTANTSSLAFMKTLPAWPLGPKTVDCKTQKTRAANGEPQFNPNAVLHLFIPQYSKSVPREAGLRPAAGQNFVKQDHSVSSFWKGGIKYVTPICYTKNRLHRKWLKTVTWKEIAQATWAADADRSVKEKWLFSSGVKGGERTD